MIIIKRNKAFKIYNAQTSRLCSAALKNYVEEKITLHLLHNTSLDKNTKRSKKDNKFN